MMDEAAAREIERLKSLVADYEAEKADTDRLVREIDVLLNGEAGAAKQASLCDIAAQLRCYVPELVALMLELKKEAIALVGRYRESERQRKQLSEYIETLAKGGIEAATGAGKREET